MPVYQKISIMLNNTQWNQLNNNALVNKLERKGYNFDEQTKRDFEYWRQLFIQTCQNVEYYRQEVQKLENDKNNLNVDNLRLNLDSFYSLVGVVIVLGMVVAYLLRRKRKL